MGSTEFYYLLFRPFPSLSLFALKLYRLSRIGKLGFFKRPLLFHRIPLFSLSSLPFFIFCFGKLLIEFENAYVENLFHRCDDDEFEEEKKKNHSSLPRKTINFTNK